MYAPMQFPLSQTCLSTDHWQPDHEGYIAFVSPKKTEYEECTAHLLDRTAYEAHQQKRQRADSQETRATPAAAAAATVNCNGNATAATTASSVVVDTDVPTSKSADETAADAATQ